MKLSVVTTLYKSAPYIEVFYERVLAAAREIADEDFEIVFVNDGSPDRSLDIAVAIAERDARVVVVDLSRNFGHQEAMMTGLAYARGRLVYLLDSDLEEEPEWLITFHAQMQAQACDVVYGVQQRRKGKWFERVSGVLYYRIFNLLTGFSVPANIVTARLMTRRYVDALLRHEERTICVTGLWHITGFEQQSQVVLKHSTSATTYTFWRKVAMLTNSVTSFSSAPLIAIFYVGVLLSLASSLYIIYLSLNWLTLDDPVSGWTSVVVSIWFLGGLIIMFIGVLGIYLSKVFLEAKARPLTIVRKVYEKIKSD